MKVLTLTFVGTILPSTPFSAYGSLPPPIVYTIAGSDSGGGAGIQADLHAIHAMNCHACSAITCLTAQNSCDVTAVHAPPASFLQTQLQTLLQDLPPRAVKIGMLGTRELAETVGAFLKESFTLQPRPWVVLDPVMISTSGHKLIDDEAKQAMIDHIFPYTDILTPNKYEAEALLGRELHTTENVEQGARDLLAMGVKSVLIKGGHIVDRDGKDSHAADMSAALGYSQDYFLSSVPRTGEERLCDGARGVWLCTAR
jgi:hydroxymethylpyrimidine kinase/phosphomethylpyrimidine kinase